MTRSINGTGWAVMVDQESVQKAVNYFNTGEVFITTYSLLVSIYSKLNKARVFLFFGLRTSPLHNFKN